MAFVILTGDVTQGSADAFAESEIATGLSGIGTRAYVVSLINAEWSPLAAVNGAELEVALTRRSKSAMPTVTDRDVIFKRKFTYRLTTSGAVLVPSVESIAPADELVIVEDPLYMCIDSGSTSAANTFRLSISCTDRRISEIERLALLARSLGTT